MIARWRGLSVTMTAERRARGRQDVTILFMLRAYPDVDHLAPLMWKCLEKGDGVLAVFWRPFPYRDDYRIRFQQRYPRFSILAPRIATSRSRLGRLAARLVWSPRQWASVLERHRVSACCVDWGRSLFPGRGWSRMSLIRRAIRDPASFGERVRLALRLLAPPPIRTALLEAARARGLPTFCLPHAVQTVLAPDYRDLLAAGRRAPGDAPPADIYGRSRYSAYVYPNEFHRQLSIRYQGIDPSVTATWGSLRYSEPWMRIVGEICPPWTGPAATKGRVRLFFAVPRWSQVSDRARLLSLLDSIVDRGDVDLVCKPHPRPTPGADADVLRRILERPGVWLATDAHTPALIDGTDAALVLASAVAIEALVKGKALIYPRYLHANRVAFDEEGACLRALGPEDVHRFLDGLARGEPVPVTPGAIDRALRTLVYGGRAPFDVPEYYYAQIRQRIDAASPRRP